MFESTISVLAWMSVILFQAVVHYHISGAHRRRGEEEAVVPALNEENEMKQSFSSTEIADDPMPHMMPYAVGEEEDEDESLDGDEPRMFFELLEQTGSEMMRVSGKRTSGQI